MKAKNIKCKKCGGFPLITEDCGPWIVYCEKCERETLAWAYKREAWKNWVGINK